MALTEKQKRFVEEYLVDLNATQAAIRAGYSAKGMNKRVTRMMANEGVQTEIEKKMKAREYRTEITQDMVLKELASIGFAKASDYAKVIEKQAVFTSEAGDRIPLYNEDGTPVMVNDVKLTLTDTLDDKQIRAIQCIKQGKYGIEIAQCDKVKALELLGRHLGMFKDRVEVSGELNAEKEKLDNIIKQLRGDG